MRMEQYNVTGMSCAACSAKVEKAVGQLEGVTSCSVSLLTNSMSVEGTATKQQIIKAVTDAGYGAWTSSSQPRLNTGRKKCPRKRASALRKPKRSSKRGTGTGPNITTFSR